MESKFTAIAAGMLYEQGLTDRLIFSTGKTAGEDYPSEAEEMIKYMKVLFPDIPDEAITVEDISYDTRGNVLESKKIIEEEGLENVGYLTVSYHFPRVFMLLDNEEVDIHVGFASDKIIRNRSPRHNRLIDAYLESKRNKHEKLKEKVLIGELLLDPHAKALDLVTRVVRHQKR
jgi:uncharacterized SAM-binding protein YcdF (DUF218 family)